MLPAWMAALRIRGTHGSKDGFHIVRIDENEIVIGPRPRRRTCCKYEGENIALQLQRGIDGGGSSVVSAPKIKQKRESHAGCKARCVCRAPCDETLPVHTGTSQAITERSRTHDWDPVGSSCELRRPGGGQGKEPDIRTNTAPGALYTASAGRQHTDQTLI